VRAWITRDVIEPARVLELVGGPGNGATVLFLGHVRDRNDGRPVAGMLYDAYVEMAERVLDDIAAGAARRLGTDDVAVVHRIGELTVGEVSVAIAVSSPHRVEAFAICREVIEAIKERVPVWKEERYVEGPPAWLAGRPPAPETAGE
jgi:molybdopterin synthase catalytic subunit